MARDHYWTIFSAVSKRDIFGIKAYSKNDAWRQLFNKIGKNAYKYRFEAKKRKIKNNSRRNKIMTNTNKNQVTKVVTGEVRLSYANIFEAKAIEEGQTPKYSTALLIPKTDKKTLNAIKKAIEAAKTAGAPKWGGKIPANLKMPLRDGDAERPDQEEYAGHYFVNANSTNKPGVVDENVQPILDSTEVYSGCYARASVNFYAFNASGNKGIACGLNNIQKLRDGETLGGRSRAEDDFDAVETDDGEDAGMDDFLN